MDIICQELNIPRRQIKETKIKDRFIILTKKSWLQLLIQNGKFSDFPVYNGLDEWPSYDNNIGHTWCKVYINIYKKYTHKVIPLPRLRADQNENEQPLSFSQLLHYISQSNHKNLWKNSYKKYSGSRLQSNNLDKKPSEHSTSVNLVPYDIVLRDVIARTYGCNIIHSKLDKLNDINYESHSGNNYFSTNGNYEPHVNLYPTISTIETKSYMVIVFDSFIENNLLDCVTYSPAILDKNHNKPLFLIYQLLNLMKTLHERGLLLGDVGLCDMYITENLWLQMIPKIDCNILELEKLPGMTDEQLEYMAPSSSINKNSSTPRSSHSNPIDFYSKYFTAQEIHLSYSLKDYSEMWCHGQLSNFDYLTILNNLSGRRIGCPGYHHIMPWVTDFISRNGTNWRDLTKSKYRLNKGDCQLDLTFSPTVGTAISHHVSDVLSEITYYVYMARRTQKSVLCKHVRPIWVPAEYPASIQRLQEWTPDECIPEFFCDPLVFKSIHEDLPDLEVPAWSSCPEDFITKHREALESQFTSERLHHWIDLTFGYKLTGPASIKAKNVCLSLVDNHTNLCQRGVVQLFSNPHPPKQYQSPWSGKLPPRIYPQNETKRRLTRSSEDLTSQYNETEPFLMDNPISSTTRYNQSPVSLSKLSNLSEDSSSSSYRSENIERSTSLHSSVQKSSNIIILPKDYNPIAQLNAVENMEVFMAKTFHHTNKVEQKKCNIDLHIKPCYNYMHFEESDNAFTNRMFSETYEASLLKDDKMLHNLRQKNQNSTKNFKQIVSERRFRELQIIGCIIVELFLSSKLRPLGSCAPQNFDQRLEACLTALRYDFDSLPKCVQYPVKLLLHLDDNFNPQSVITEKGLPNPSAHQFLQPLLSNTLFPFPLNYIKVYCLVKSLYQFGSAGRLMDLYTFFECDGKQCSKYKPLDKIRIAFQRKIAVCKVNSCVIQIKGLLDLIGYEQFNPVELLLPHIVDLIRNDDTSILAAWNLFDNVATALGSTETQKFLLNPVLQLYDAESNERTSFLNSNFDSSMKFTTSAAFKSQKSYKLYHHTFLLKLIVRFGLKCFLENFISPLIEGVGGYKDPETNLSCHYHDNSNSEFRKSRSTKNLKFCNDPELPTSVSETTNTLISPSNSDKTISPNVENKKDDEMFDFESELPKDGTDEIEGTIKTIIDDFDIKSESSSLGLRLNHSQAEEATEETPIADENYQISDFIYGEEQMKFYTELGKINSSFDEDRLSIQSIDSLTKSPSFFDLNTAKSLTIPIPATLYHGKQLSVIGCDIGSKKSFDSNDFFARTPNDKENTITADNGVVKPSLESIESSINLKSTESKYTGPSQISDTSAESLIWLSHRLGPVLSARNLTRNLLKMLTLCYVGQENLFPSIDIASTDNNLNGFSIADGRVIGDQNAVKVLECLSAISALFGDQFILLQYFPHVSELIALCKKRITASLEGGLISSLQLLKYLIPYLSDATIMDQLHDVILRSIVHPIIRLLGSSRCTMPSGFLARSVLARKLLDTLYVIANRIGPEMTKEHLCVPALQRFFFIFNKAYGINDPNKLDIKSENSPSQSSDENNFVELKRDGGTREWHIKGKQITQARVNGDDSFDLTPPVLLATSSGSAEQNTIREKAIDEIQDVFTPNLAHVSYVTFLNYLGESVMSQTVKNLPLILNLCHEFVQPNLNQDGDKELNTNEHNEESMDPVCSNSFGKVTVSGNRIEVQNEPNKYEMGPSELLNIVTYKADQITTARHLRGNWLAYWEHEIGRPDKDNHFNLKQIKLQTYSGHTNSVRSIICLDNENSFMSASKDKTVKLWSLRSEGDGTNISSCKFTYNNHRKSVHSLTFLESLRWVVSCDSGVHIWDPLGGDQLGQLESSRFSPVTIVKTFPAPSCLILCGTTDSSVKIIDARCMNYVNEWKVSTNLSSSVRCMAVSPSGAWIAVGLSSGQLILLDGRSGVILASWKANDGELLQLTAPNDSQLISSSLDHTISVWNTIDGSLMFHMKGPPEPAHCLISNGLELISGTPANRIGVHSSISQSAQYSITKLRSENFRGVLTSLAVLPLNRMLLVGGDSGNISLLC